MRKSWLVCVFLGTMAWGQAAGTPPPAQPGQGGAPMPGMQQAPAAPPDTSAAVPPEEPVLTVKGVCPAKPAAAKGAAAAKTATAAKTPAADCKTVITKAEFEKLAAGVAPNMTPQLRKQLASVLPRLIAMSAVARKKGLDKTERFRETVKFAQMQILTNELNRQIQEEAAKVPATDIADYYKKNPEAFEQFNLDRLFVPRTKQLDAEDKDIDEEKDAKLTDEQKKAKEAADKAKADQGELEMTKLADALRARAAAGEEFVKLQKEAFDAAGMKIDSPTVNLPKVRRTGLPPGHAAAFDLKVGDVSPVINDSGGHYIYKVISKDALTQDQAQAEIHSTLQNQRTREMTDAVQKSFTVDTNEKYFGPPGPAGNVPPRRIPNPRMVPGPTTPQGQPPVPPPAPQPN